MPTTVEAFKEWQDLKIPDIGLGGVVLDQDSENLENNQLLKATSMVLRDKKLQTDTGYAQVLTEIADVGRRHVTYEAPDGTSHEILITNTTVYKNVNSQWRAVKGTVGTTLSGDEALGQTTLSLTSIVGFSDNDRVGIVLDSGQMHYTTINGAPGGGTIVVDDALPSAAASGNAVVKLDYLTGTNDVHVTAEPIPWDNWLVFTNGIDPVQRFDPDANDVTTITNITNVIAQTLAVYDSSLVLGNVVEGGTARKYRYKYSAKGDVTNWTTLEAGNVDLLNTDSAILQLLKLGPWLIAYRDKAIHRIAVSSSFIRRFDNDTAVHGVGVFSNYGAVDLIDRHIVWSHDGIYEYVGGFSVTPIENSVFTTLFGPNGELTEDTMSRAFAMYLGKFKEIVFVYQNSSDTAPQSAIRFHLSHPEAWTTRRFGHEIRGFGSRVSGDSLDWSELIGDWSAQPGSWASYNTFGNVEQATFTLESYVVAYNYSSAVDSNGDGDEPIVATVETKDFSDEVYESRHDYLDVFCSGGTIEVEYSTDKGDSWDALGTITASNTVTRYRLFKQFTSRFFRYRFTTEEPMKLTNLHTRYKLEFEH